MLLPAPTEAVRALGDPGRRVAPAAVDGLRAGPAPAPAQGLSAERTVALTDLALGVEAAAFALMLARDERSQGSPLRGPLITFFATTAAASLAGAALHGLTTDRSDPRRRALWRLSLGSIGMAGLSSWWLGARLSLGRGKASIVEGGATVVHIPYLAAVLRSDQPFWVAILSYLPGAVFLGGSLVSRLRDRHRRRPAALGLAGLGVTFAAAGVQVAKVGVGRRFDHNALYHAMQAIGVALFFRAAKGWLAASSGQPPGRQ